MVFLSRAAVCIPRPDLPRAVPTRASNPWNDVGHGIGANPVDDAGIGNSHMKPRRNPGVPRTTINRDHVRHAPGPIRVIDDHGHSRLDAQETGSDLGVETPLARSTAIPFTLVQQYSHPRNSRGQEETLRAQGTGSMRCQFRSPVAVVVEMWILIDVPLRSQKRTLRIPGIPRKWKVLKNGTAINADLTLSLQNKSQPVAHFLGVGHAVLTPPVEKRSQLKLNAQW